MGASQNKSIVNRQLKEILSELKGRLQELYGERLVQLVLFGSHARGDAVEGSDIDVLVVLSGEVNASREIDRTSEIIWSISFEHDTVICCVFVGENEYRRRNGPLLRNVRREGVLI